MRHSLTFACSVLLSGAFFAQSLTLAHGAGLDQHVDAGPDPALVPSSGLTVEALVQYDETAVTAGLFRWPTIVRMNPTPASENYLLRVDASNNATRNVRFMVRTQNAGAVSAVATFAAGQLSSWTHIAGTYDGSFVKIYFDGVEVASTPTNGGPIVPNSTDVLRIGNGDLTAPGQEVWSGQIDEVRIWPIALAADELLRTKDLELQAMLAGTLTFNFNGNFTETSAGIATNAVGSPVVDPLQTPLTQQFSSGGGYGSSSSTCGAISALFASPPQVDNPVFRPRATGVTPGAAGVFFASLGMIPLFPIAGIDVAIDPNLIRITIPVLAADSLGTAQVFAGIPNDPALGGRTYFSQFLFLDGVCGGPNLTSSQGLAITILP